MGAVAFVLQGRLEAPAQVSEVRCVKNPVPGMSLHKPAGGKDELGAGRLSAVGGLWNAASCACGHWAGFPF